MVLEPAGCAQAGKCILKNKLHFTDGNHLVWKAAAGLETEGASIPPFFQPFVGQPFETSFLKAAIVHDHYCDRHVRPWRVTHQVFYEGLIRGSDYENFDMRSELATLANELQADPDALTLEQLEQRAKSRRPDDYYYRNGDKVQVNVGLITE